MHNSEILKIVGPGLDRHLIRRWAALLRGSVRNRSGDGRGPREDYSADEVGFLIRMCQASLEDFSPKDAAERLRTRWFERQTASHLPAAVAALGAELASSENSELQSTLLGISAVPATALNRGLGLDRVARAGCVLLGAERCSIFLRHEADLVLVADSQRHGDPTRLGFRISNYLESQGWTAWVAREGRPVNKVGPELDEAYKKRGEVTPPRERKSLIAVPLIHRKKKKPLWGVIKAQNKIPGHAMNLAAFDDNDERIMAAIAAMTVPLLELQRFLSGGVHLLNQLNTSNSFYQLTSDIMDAAMIVTSADRGEFVRWEPEKGGVDEKVAGEVNELKEGTVHNKPRPGVTDKVFWDGKPYLIENTKALKEPGVYIEANPETNSEVAVRIDVGSKPVGVLNLESNRIGADERDEGDGGHDRADIPLLEVLSGFASIAFQMTALRNAFVENLAKGELNVALERAIGIAQEEARPSKFVGIGYRPDYRKGRLLLDRSLGRVEDVERAKEEFSFEENKSGKSERSLAGDVFRAKEGKPVPVPERDPRVYYDGLEKLGVKGSMIGVPVVLNSEMLGPTVVIGVLILWNVSDGGKPVVRINEETGTAVINRCRSELALQLKLV